VGELAIDLLLGWGVFEVRVVCKGHGELRVSVDGQPLAALDVAGAATRCAITGCQLLQRHDFPRNFHRDYHAPDVLKMLDPYISFLLAEPRFLRLPLPQWLTHPTDIRTLAGFLFQLRARRAPL